MMGCHGLVIKITSDRLATAFRQFLISLSILCFIFVVAGANASSWFSTGPFQRFVHAIMSTANSK